jgi:hypothetical protein
VATEGVLRGHRRWRKACVLLGGPLVNVGLALAGLCVMPPLSLVPWAAVLGTVVVNVWKALYNLLPGQGMAAGTVVLRDGQQLWALLRAPRNRACCLEAREAQSIKRAVRRRLGCDPWMDRIERLAGQGVTI